MSNTQSIRITFSMVACVLALLAAGCQSGPQMVTGDDLRAIDRAEVEYPAGATLLTLVRGLTAPAAVAFDNQGNMLVAEGAVRNADVRVHLFTPDGQRVQIYPWKPRLFTGSSNGLTLYGPVGGMRVYNNRVYITHRDRDDRGRVTWLGFDGTWGTVVGDLPARGDHSVTDLAFSPTGRLFFGVGSATNSGVVGLDNWKAGWPVKHRDIADVPLVSLRLRGFRFDTPNPQAGWFGSDSLLVTGPFQPLGVSSKTAIDEAPTGKPNAAIYSVDPDGGPVRVEAHGIRCPRGLGFNTFGRLYATNNGMELRGTRPVKNDPDVMLRVVTGGTWYGWPDFSADLRPVTEPEFAPPDDMIVKTGYPDLTFLLDHEASGLLRPDRNTLLAAVLPSLSGATRFDFFPETSQFREWRGNAVVPLWGDSAPFATSGQKLKRPMGRKLVRIDVDDKRVHPFIHNTLGKPAHQLPGRTAALERPTDAKFGPDGSLYIVDMGQVEVVDGRPIAYEGTGRVLVLVKTQEATSANDIRNALVQP